MGTDNIGTDRWRRHLPRLIAVAALLGLLAPVASCSTDAEPERPAASPTPSIVERDTQELAVGAGPTALALDDRGRLWTVNSVDGTVARIANDGRKVELTVSVGGHPQRATWWAGALWVAVRDDDVLVRVDGKTGTITDRVAVGDAPVDVVAAYGLLWVVTSGDGELIKVDPSERVRRPPVRSVGKGARRITAGGDAIWVSNPATQRVLKIDPQTSVVTPFPATCQGPEGMSARDGLLWVACAASGEAVALDEITGEPIRRVAIPGQPDSLAPASGANLWVSVHSGPGLVLIDPRGAKVNSRWPITHTSTATPSPIKGADSAPVDLTQLGNRVWLTSYGEGRIYGVDVTPGPN